MRRSLHEQEIVKNSQITIGQDPSQFLLQGGHFLFMFKFLC